MKRLAVLLLALTPAVTAAPPVEARELHWRALDIEARLESDGTLVVSERHAMVFTGDWNGGERSFRLGLGHRIEIDGLYRRDPAAGAWQKVQRGSLDRVDRWNWHDSRTIRWRSRLPSDAAFHATEIDYRIDYRLSGILIGEGREWRLDHDFAFTDRIGPIERFSLELEFAPEWRVASAPPPRVEAGPLPPGRGYVVTTGLLHQGEAPPEMAGPTRLPREMRYAATAAAALGAVALFAWAIGRERTVGKFHPLPPVDSVDRAWVEEHLLTLPPEEVGAAWDGKIGAAEVAAVLARLQLEGKISSRVEEKSFFIFRQTILHLSLLVPRSQFTDTEKALIRGLFPKGDSTDTATLRKYYKTTGFDPASKIRSGLERALARHPEFRGSRRRPARWPSVIAILGGLAAVVSAIVAAPADGPAPGLLGAGLFATWLPGYAGAFALRDRVAGFRGPTIALVIGHLASLALFAGLALLPSMSMLGLGAGLLLYLGLTRTQATSMQTRQGPKKIGSRRELALARAWLEAELERPAPRFDDSWVPYLIALGLSPAMDRWFRAFGQATNALPHAAAGSAWSGSSGTSGGSGWTGGGGAFGGAGATAGWAAAATAMSAGVTAASSGGSGGGGGGGGGSSGGGGGGGW